VVVDDAERVRWDEPYADVAKRSAVPNPFIAILLQPGGKTGSPSCHVPGLAGEVVDLVPVPVDCRVDDLDLIRCQVLLLRSLACDNERDVSASLLDLYQGY